MKLRTFFAGLLSMSLLLPVVSAEADEKSAAPTESDQFSGEVVDMNCYGSRGARGDEHRACAIRCIESGTPAGLITDDGRLFLLVGSDLVRKLEGKIGVHVVVEGREMERDGLMIIRAEAVELAREADG